MIFTLVTDGMTTDVVETQLANLITVSWILLIPAGLLVVLLLYKMVYLLHTVSEFVSISRFELYPLLQSLQRTADHVDKLTGKVVAGVEQIERGIENTKPMVADAARKVADGMSSLSRQSGSLFSGLLGLFGRRR